MVAKLLVVVDVNQHSDPLLLNVQSTETSESSALKRSSLSYPHSSLSLGNTANEETDGKKSQRWWMATRKLFSGRDRAVAHMNSYQL